VLGLVALSLGTPDGCGDTSVDLIGAEGGTVRSADGLFSLEIPEDALDSPVQISVHTVDCEPENAANCYQIKPAGVIFTYPATATYEAADLPTMEAVTLTVKSQDGWHEMPDLIVDEEDETVAASVLYSSSFAVVAD